MNCLVLCYPQYRTIDSSMLKFCVYKSLNNARNAEVDELYWVCPFTLHPVLHCHLGADTLTFSFIVNIWFFSPIDGNLSQTVVWQNQDTTEASDFIHRSSEIVVSLWTRICNATINNHLNNIIIEKKNCISGWSTNMVASIILQQW